MSHPEFADYVQGLIDDHRAMDDPPDDVITRFIHTDVDGEYLSDQAIRTQTMFLIVAGNETTRNLIGNCLYVLATRPDLFEQVRAEPERIPPFVEESLRLDAPVQVLARAVLDDTEIEGCPLHAGDRVVFGLASANRDEAAYDDPTEFRLDRAAACATTSRSVPGPHVCPGASLARLEAVAVLDEVCDARRRAAPRRRLRARPQPGVLGQRPSLPAGGAHAGLRAGPASRCAVWQHLAPARAPARRGS